MGVTVLFGKHKHKRVLYTTKRANTVISLYFFFKTHKGFNRSRDIKAAVKVTNTTLWFLAYQNFLTVHPKFCRYTDPTGAQRYAQVYVWKPNLERFAQFAKEAKLSTEKLEKLKKEAKDWEQAAVDDILKKQEEFEVNPDEAEEEPIEDDGN